MSLYGSARYLLASIATLALHCGCAHTPGDPAEPFNRKVHRVNDAGDRYLVRPLARGYVKVTPRAVTRAISNFFDNAGYSIVIVNQFLQGKPKAGSSDIGRLLLNSTVGIGGLIDVARHVGLEKHEEDFGQTFGGWGIGTGPYLVLPLLGPTTVRDGLGSVLDELGHPVRHVSPPTRRYSLTGIRLLDARARVLDAESLIRGDRYLYIRDAYLQRREFLVNDGVVDEDPFLDDD